MIFGAIYLKKSRFLGHRTVLVKKESDKLKRWVEAQHNIRDWSIIKLRERNHICGLEKKVLAVWNFLMKYSSHVGCPPSRTITWLNMCHQGISFLFID